MEVSGPEVRLKEGDGGTETEKLGCNVGRVSKQHFEGKEIQP